MYCRLLRLLDACISFVFLFQLCFRVLMVVTELYDSWFVVAAGVGIGGGMLGMTMPGRLGLR